MATTSIFQQYLQAPQSVSSKIAALDQADFQRAQMEGAVRQNRLQELAFQRDEESRANAARRGGAIQSILSQAGGDEAAAVKGLRQAGFYDEAGKMESDLLGRTEKRATIAGKETENAAKSFQQRRTELDTAIRDITMFETPEQALADLQSKVQAGKLPPEQAQGMAQLIQTNPQWQTKLLRGLMQAKDQLDLDEKQAARAQQGQQSAAQLAQAAELARLQDATARRGQDVSAATARRGQDLSAQDAAARRAAEAAKTTADKPLTEAQAKATAFLGQMRAASKAIGELMPDQSNMAQQADVMLAGSAGNVISSPKAQQIKQAQNQWSESFLRFKTGAAATIDEVALNNKTFFPQFGDSKEVIRQKERMRQQAEQDMETVAAQGAQKVQVVGGSGEAGSASRPASTPKAGDVMQGYRFKGGNPADKANWEKM